MSAVRVGALRGGGAARVIPWETIDAGAEGGPDEGLSLHRRGEEWSIRTQGVELMNSRRFGSERALATLAADAGRRGAERVLIGGLGMGHTLAAALQVFPKAEVTVSEISPRLIEWNRELLGELAASPLAHARSEVVVGDVADLIRAAAEGSRPGFDAILLDVDNGPEALSRSENAFLYSSEGLAAGLAALTHGGVLAIWSAGSEPRFERRLHQMGCDLRTHRVSPRGAGRGRARHTIWIARPLAR